MSDSLPLTKEQETGLQDGVSNGESQKDPAETIGYLIISVLFRVDVAAHRRDNNRQDDGHGLTHHQEGIGPPLEAYAPSLGKVDTHQGYAHVDDQKFGQRLPDRSQVGLADHTVDDRSKEHPREEFDRQLHLPEPSVLHLLRASR